MKRCSLVLVLLLVVCQALSFSFLPSVSMADETKTVRVIYYRFDQEYSTWNLWIWPKGGNGASYQFTKETELSFLPGKKAVVAEVDVSAFNTEEAGIIVRKGEWEQKDIEADRFFSLKNADSNGITTLYIIQGIETISFTEEDAKPYYSPKIESAEFMDLNTVRVYLQAPAEALGGNEGIRLMEGNKEVRLSKVIRGDDGKGFVLKTEGEIDMSKGYIIEKEGFGQVYVSMDRLFGLESFNEQFYYEGNDLGATYSKSETVFKLWAPTAEAVTLKLFEKGQGGTALKSIAMEKAEKGVWSTVVSGDLNGTYYTYEVTVGGKTNTAVDPYAKAVGVNGDRAMVVDLSSTNPEGWEKVGYVNLENQTDAVIYEMHVRDTSIDDSSGIKNKGKYAGMGETGGKSPISGVTTGLSHVKELGATHIHFLPVFDFNSVDESRLDIPQFNWGYDPRNYNTPEGSYSADPYNGEVRIREFKEMIKAIKEQGIGVVMDVVYNHTARSADSDFSLIVPGYYYRMVGNKFSNGSGCGNETASERLLMRKFIVDSVCYWAREYKIDGFRFDLMGLHDIETMNAVAAALKEINPSVLLYGEGWTAGATTLPQNQQAIKANISKVPDFAVFNDSTRDGIKGHVFDSQKPGFINGDYSFKESIKFGIVGAVNHSGVRYEQVNYDKAAFAASPNQCINYISAHDNLTLYDKLVVSAPGRIEEDYKKMTKIGGAMVLTSQGIPFMLSGTDFMRSKKGDSNSYKSPDSINAIDWELKSKNFDVFEYYKGLISLRKAHPAFRMPDAAQINENLKFIDDTSESLIAYYIDNNANGDTWKTIFVAFNAGDKDETVSLPVNSDWNIVVNGDKAGVETISAVSGDKITVPAMSSIIAYDAATATKTADSKKLSSLLPVALPVLAGLLILTTGGALYLKKKKGAKSQ